MKRTLFSSLGAALALLLAGATQPATTSIAKAGADLTAQRNDTTSRTPQAPVQPAKPGIQLAVRTRGPALDSTAALPRHYHDVPRARRVKYGKSRWVVLS